MTIFCHFLTRYKNDQSIRSFWIIIDTNSASLHVRPIDRLEILKSDKFGQCQETRPAPSSQSTCERPDLIESLVREEFR